MILCLALSCLARFQDYDLTIESLFQVNRVGELKLSLEERERSLATARAKLEAVRREAEVERTAQEEKARFDAHRPLKYVPRAVGDWFCPIENRDLLRWRF